MLHLAHLRRFPRVFQTMTGLSLPAFDLLLADILPAFAAAEQQRLSRPSRKRALGAGRRFELAPSDQILLAIIWLRQYPAHLVLGFLFGVSHPTVGRIIQRVVPLLEAAGQDTMRMPQPSKRKRRSLEQLLEQDPELLAVLSETDWEPTLGTPSGGTKPPVRDVTDAPEERVIVDTFEQRVQRPKPAPPEASASGEVACSGAGAKRRVHRQAADRFFSGKKKQHTLKSQVLVDGRTGRIVDIAQSVAGPTADLTVLKESKVVERIGEDVGLDGDLAYVGLEKLHAKGRTPRRKPRGKERPAEDVVYNREFSRQRIGVEHTIGRLRRFESLTQMDRHHRKGHTMRVRAVAGLVNRMMAHGRAG